MNVWLLLEPQDEGMIYPDQLYHHGIKGMHWGIRRFQPYGPGQKVKGGKEVGIATKVKQRVTGTVEGIKQHRAAKKEAKAAKKAEAERKAQVEHQLSKQQAIEKGTIEDLVKFKGELSNEEYGRAFARLQNEQRLDAMVAANQKTAWDTMDKGMEIVNKLAGYAGTVANAKNKFDAMSDALNKKKDKQKAEDELKEKNKFLTNIQNITELNEGMDKHKITPKSIMRRLTFLLTRNLSKQHLDRISKTRIRRRLERKPLSRKQLMQKLEQRWTTKDVIVNRRKKPVKSIRETSILRWMAIGDPQMQLANTLRTWLEIQRFTTKKSEPTRPISSCLL